MNEKQRQLDDLLPPDLALLLNALRSEWDTKLQNVKLWGSIAMLGGGTIGGVVGARFAPEQVKATLGVAATLLGLS